MINGVSSNLSLNNTAASGAGPAGNTVAGSTGGVSFADTLKNSITEVSQLQQDASRAVQDLAAGRREDVDGVMNAMQKADLAFKTLLSIRGKLMDAYEEIKQISV